MAEVAIVRTEIFTVESASPDSYENLIVTDKAGVEHRINSKHSSLHPIFQPGKGVEVGYGNFMNREFIHTAKLVDGGMPEPKAPKQPVLQSGESPMADEAIKMGAKVTRVDNVKNRAVAISYSKDLVCHDKIELKQMKGYADKFLDYIENRP